MRHPPRTSGSVASFECSLTVALVDGFVVAHVFGEAVPENFHPAVAGARSAVWWLFPAAVLLS